MKALTKPFLFLLFLTVLLIATLGYATATALQLYNQGVELGAQGHFAEAKASFEQTLYTDPQSYPSMRCLTILTDIRELRIQQQTGMHLFRAISYFNRYKTDEAIEELNKAAELDPRYAPIYSHRGDAYRDKKNFDQALKDYTTAVDIDPKYATAYLNRGNLYATKSQLDLAIADYNRALDAEPQNVLAYYSRGNTYEKQGLYEQAVADYNRVFEVNPLFPHAYVRKGLALEKLGHMQEALATYKAYLQKLNLRDQGPRQVDWVKAKIKSMEKEH